METHAIKENKTFSWDRFSVLMKADLAVNKSNYVKLAIGSLGIFAALAILISIIAIIDINSLKHVAELTERSFEEAIQTKQSTFGSMYLGISIWIFCIGITVLGSLTFSNLSTKRQRISSLMLPASQIEKFILRFLIYFVAGTLMLLIGMLIGLGISQLAYGGGHIALEDAFSYINKGISGTIITFLILSTILGNSIYALGSALWPKLSWIKTWIVMMVLEWIGVIFLTFISAADISWYSFFMFWKDHVSLLKWTGLSALAILNIACWVFAWLRYRNTQIVQRFMTK